MKIPQNFVSEMVACTCKYVEKSSQFYSDMDTRYDNAYMHYLWVLH